MVDIQCATADIRQGKKEEERRRKKQDKNIMACPIPYGGHKYHRTTNCQTQTLHKQESTCDHIFDNKCYNSAAVAKMDYCLATIDMDGPKSGGCCAPFCGGSWVSIKHNVIWPRPTSVPSGILIHPTVWPRYTNVTDRQENGSIA